MSNLTTKQAVNVSFKVGSTATGSGNIDVEPFHYKIIVKKIKELSV